MGKDMEQGVAPVVLYVTEMLRWGSEEDHHYVHGVYSTRAAAAKAGDVEQSWRGGKYEPRIVECVLDSEPPEEELANHCGIFRAKEEQPWLG